MQREAINPCGFDFWFLSPFRLLVHLFVFCASAAEGRKGCKQLESYKKKKEREKNPPILLELGRKEIIRKRSLRDVQNRRAVTKADWNRGLEQMWGRVKQASRPNGLCGQELCVPYSFPLKPGCLGGRPLRNHM